MTRVTLENCLTGGVHLTNLGWSGMSSVKSFGILDEGWGVRVGALSAPIAVIADIARDRRHRKGKVLPLINTDITDRNTGLKWVSPGLNYVSTLES